MTRRSIILIHILPVVLLAAGTIAFLVTDLDLRIQRAFYYESTGAWFRDREQPWRFFYKHGALPALVLVILSFCVLVLGLAHQRLAPLRRQASFLVLLFLGAPLLLSKLALPPLWGRPAPADVAEFGGTQAFEPILAFHAASSGTAFPAYHAALGFYFLGIALLLFAGRHRFIGFLVLLLALGLGTVNGIATLATGANFASDILWAAGLTWLCAAGLFHVLGLSKGLLYQLTADSFTVPKWAPTAALVLIALISLAWPNSTDYQSPLIETKPLPDTIRLNLELEGRLEIARGEKLHLETTARGFGLPGSRVAIDQRPVDGLIQITHERRGAFTRLDVLTRLTLPPDRIYKIQVGRATQSVAIHPPEQFDPTEFAYVELSLFATTTLPNLESEPLDEDFLGRTIYGFSF